MRPSTEGCTEWSCMYHGEENRFKAGHEHGCPLYSYGGFLLTGTIAEDEGPACACTPSVDPAIYPQSRFDADHRPGMEDAE